MAERSRRLAYVYHPSSFPTLTLAEAATPLAELVWVVDRSLPATETMCPLLARLGEVVDIAGLSPADAADVVAAVEPDGIVTFADARLEITAQIAERLGLPFISRESAISLTDKHAQRRALAAGGVAVPRSCLAPALEDEAAWRQLAAQIGFPAVLKPRVGEGSRDTYKVCSLAEARACAAAATAGRPERPLVLEEYLADATGRREDGFGGYVSVECVAIEGVITPVAITGRFPPAEPFRETGFFIPHALAPAEAEEVVACACQAARAVAMTIGCMHIEIKLTPAGPRVIEVNGRLGGGIPEMLSDAAGVDLYDVAYRLALGERPAVPAMVACNEVGWLLYVHAPDWMSRVVEVDGLEELSRHPAVREVLLNRRPGESVDWREGNHGHVFSVRGVARDHDQVRALARHVEETVLIKGD